jgi:hypothetical protein
MMLVRADEQQMTRNPPPPEFMPAMDAFIGEMYRAGTLLDTGGLATGAEAARLRLSNGRQRITDGPYTEAKEVIGGYAVVKASSRAEAIDLARRFMAVHELWPGCEVECEVREIIEAPSGPK